MKIYFLKANQNSDYLKGCVLYAIIILEISFINYNIMAVVLAITI